MSQRLLFRTENTRSKHTKWDDLAMVQRIRSAPVITTQSVNFTPQHAAEIKKGQGWKYKGGNVIRAPSVELGSKTYTDPKSAGLPRRKQESNFLITMNTNKSFPLESPEYSSGVRALKSALTVLAQDRVIAKYIKFGPKDNHYLEDEYADVIDSIDWHSGIETGPHRNRLHAHVWLTITHYSQIQINCDTLAVLLKKAYNDNKGTAPALNGKPYVAVKLLHQSDWTDIMKQYIHKAMSSKPDCEST